MEKKLKEFQNKTHMSCGQVIEDDYDYDNVCCLLCCLVITKTMNVVVQVGNLDAKARVPQSMQMV